MSYHGVRFPKKFSPMCVHFLFLLTLCVNEIYTKTTEYRSRRLVIMNEEKNVFLDGSEDTVVAGEFEPDNESQVWIPIIVQDETSEYTIFENQANHKYLAVKEVKAGSTVQLVDRDEDDHRQRWGGEDSTIATDSEKNLVLQVTEDGTVTIEAATGNENQNWAFTV